MATEKIAKMFEAAEGNTALRSAVEGADDAEGLVRIGAEHGFEFTVDDVEDVLEQMRQPAGEELDEDALEKVAGGFGDVNLFKSLGDTSIKWTFSGDLWSTVKPVPATHDKWMP